MRLTRLLATLLLLAPATALASGNLCSTQACEVYASSDTDLYQVDPTSLAQTHLCTFSGIPTNTVVTDIAVSAAGELWGVTEHGLFTIDTSTCAATQVAALTPSGTDWVCLAFTASGTLIAADTTGDVVTIDTTSGTVADAGNFNGYGCSGDIIAIDDSNQTIYATATDPTCTTGDCYDLLVSLDPSQGYAATVVGNTGYYTVFGLGYWGGLIYGFTHGGITLQLDPTTGASTYISGTTPEVPFSGGATTPLAPTTCTSACDGGTTQCDPSGALDTCFLQSNGCTVWMEQACDDGRVCTDGACVVAPTSATASSASSSSAAASTATAASTSSSSGSASASASASIGTSSSGTSALSGSTGSAASTSGAPTSSAGQASNGSASSGATASGSSGASGSGSDSATSAAASTSASSASSSTSGSTGGRGTGASGASSGDSGASGGRSGGNGAGDTSASSASSTSGSGSTGSSGAFGGTIGSIPSKNPPSVGAHSGCSCNSGTMDVSFAALLMLGALRRHRT